MQDVARGLKEFFKSPEWTQILECGKESEQLQIRLLGKLHKICIGLQRLFVSWADTPLQPIADAMTQIGKMCRCFLHLHAWQGGDNELESTTSADVFEIVQYKGKDSFERHFKTVLSEDRSWWQAQVSEVARTAGSRALLEAPLAELTEILATANKAEAVAIGGTDMSRICELLEVVQKGLRSKELEQVTSDCKNVVMKVAKDMMSKGLPEGDAQAAGRKINAVVSLLNRFGHVAEVPTLLDDFNHWLQANRGLRASAEFCDMMKNAMSGQIDFPAVKKMIPGNIEIPSTDEAMFSAAAANFLHKAFAQIIGEAGVRLSCDSNGFPSLLVCQLSVYL